MKSSFSLRLVLRGLLPAALCFLPACGEGLPDDGTADEPTPGPGANAAGDDLDQIAYDQMIDDMNDPGAFDEEDEDVDTSMEGLQRPPGGGGGGGGVFDPGGSDPSPSEYPVCADCEYNGGVYLYTDANGNISWIGTTFYTARTRLGQYGLHAGSDIQADSLMVFASITSSGAFLNLDLTGFTTSKWVESDGVSFSSVGLVNLPLTAAQRNPANWGYVSNNTGYVAYVGLANGYSPTGKTLLTMPVKRYINGHWVTYRAPAP